MLSDITFRLSFHFVNDIAWCIIPVNITTHNLHLSLALTCWYLLWGYQPPWMWVSATLNVAFSRQQTKERERSRWGSGRSARCYQSITDQRGQKQLLSLSVWPSCGQCRTTSLRFTYGYLDKDALIQVSRGAIHFDWSVCWVQRLF